MEELEKAFKDLTRILLGKELSDIQTYSKWLQENVRLSTEAKSAVSGRIIYLPYFPFFQATRDGVVKLDEMEETGRRRIGKKELETLSIGNATETLRSIKFYCPEIAYGQNVKVEKATLYGFSSYCDYGEGFLRSKYCAYSMWPRESEYIFGSDFIFSSRFCLKCYKSENLTRCFEVSHSNSCSDCYFCHNCDNLQECMFCFNAKSLRYAIGNVEVGKEEYLKVKARILASIFERLEKEKRLAHSIFNIGCPKRN